MKHAYKSHIQWGIIAVTILFEVLTGINENNTMAHLGPILSVACFCAFSFYHGTARYGLKNMLVFFLICFAVSFAYENISILTGFPFSFYHYTGNLGIKLLLVPLVIMPAYFGTAYLSWSLAQVLADDLETGRDKNNIVIVPVLASFIMVMWDFVMDPVMSTVDGNWIWHKGGAFFGVPFMNYMGWYLCVYTFFQLFALYEKRTRHRTSPAVASEKGFWMQAALMYAVVPSFIFGKMIFGANRAITALDGHAWWTGDIYTASALIMITTMLFVSVLAAVRISKGKTYSREGL